jgi:hypothetical protein
MLIPRLPVAMEFERPLLHCLALLVLENDHKWLEDDLKGAMKSADAFRCFDTLNNDLPTLATK